MYSQVNDRNSSDRFSVADILSSMANGVGESSPATTSASIGGLTSGIPTRTTPTLTPTTLKNIEESFLELQSIPAPLEHQHQAGFVPPVVSFSGIPSKQEEVQQWVEDCVQQSAERNVASPAPSQIHVSTSVKTGRGGGRRPLKDEKLSPEEEERRRVRRERNKLAAARCRKRRMDHTNNLLQETDGLEEKRQSLQNEIHMLTCQKEELEFLLEAHKTTCKMANQQHSKDKSSEKLDLSKLKYVRPNSLPLSSAYCSPDISGSLKTEPGVAEIAGVPISTPSSGMFNFDSLMEGNNNLNLSHGTLSSSCGGQQRSSSSDLSSPDSITPPKLVSL